MAAYSPDCNLVAYSRDRSLAAYTHDYNLAICTHGYSLAANNHGCNVVEEDDSAGSSLACDGKPASVAADHSNTVHDSKMDYTLVGLRPSLLSNLPAHNFFHSVEFQRCNCSSCLQIDFHSYNHIVLPKSVKTSRQLLTLG